MPKKTKRRKAPSKWVAFGMVLAGLLCGGLGQAAFSGAYYRTSYMVLGCLLAASGAFLLWRSVKALGPVQALEAADPAVPVWAEATALLLIVVLSAALRIHNLENQPFGGFRDEAESGNIGIMMLNGEPVYDTGTSTPVYIEYIYQNPAGYFYPVTLFFKLFGISMASVRLSSAFFGFMSVAAFYFLARRLFGIPLGLMLAFAMGTLRWHINFSRFGSPGMMTLFFEVPFYYFLYHSLQEGEGDKKKSVAWGPLAGTMALAVLPVLANLTLAIFESLNRTLGISLEHWGFSLFFLALQVPLAVVLFRSLKDRRSRFFILVGASLALSLYSYLAARLLLIAGAIYFYLKVFLHSRPMSRLHKSALVACAVFLVLCALMLIEGSARQVKALSNLGVMFLVLGGLSGLLFTLLRIKCLAPYLKPLALMIGAFLIMGAPLLNYMGRHPLQMVSRAERVSVFNDKEADKRPWGIKIKEEISATLGMYNIRGDGNPRHNLPNEIMLNPGLAALFALGVFLCLFTITDIRSQFFLLWWQLTLLAGYFSIEAPQAYRTIGAIPVVILMVGLALEPLLRAARRVWPKDWKIILLPVLGALLALGGFYEIHTYFVRQANDPGCWAEFSSSENLMGEELKSRQPNTRGLLRPDWADSWVVRFRTYPERDFDRFDPSLYIPLRNLGPYKGRNWLYLLDQSYLPLLPMIKSYYPKGVYSEQRHPYTGELLYWSYYVPSSETEKVQELKNGLTGNYYHDDVMPAEHWRKSNLVFTRVDPFILFNWTVDPVPGFFSVNWSGRIKIEKSGKHRFSAMSNDYAEVTIAGRKVLEKRHEIASLAEVSGEIDLRAGMYPIQVRYFEARNYSRMELWWQQPGGAKEVLPSTVLFPK